MSSQMPDKVEKSIDEVLSGVPPSDTSAIICDFDAQKSGTDAKILPVVGDNVVYVVVAIVINEKDEVLMMQEAKKSCAGKWYLPAGRLEKGEHIVEATEREVLEETGLHIKCISLLVMESSRGCWFRFVLVGNIVGGQLKTPAQADQESLQAKWIRRLEEVPLRSNDIVPLIDRAREQKLAKQSSTPWHADILPAMKPHNRQFLRLVVLVRKKSNNKVHVLLSEHIAWHLPVCEINPIKSLHSTLHAFMVEIFGADVPTHRPHGLLAVEFHSKDNNGGFCVTLLVGFKTALEETPIIGKYMWHETTQQLGDRLAERISMKNSTIPLKL